MSNTKSMVMGCVLSAIIAVLLSVVIMNVVVRTNNEEQGRGGDTNLDSLVLDNDLTVGDDVTIGDDLNITDDIVMTGDTTTINGITTLYSRTASLTPATTTVCARQGPSATSTLKAGGITFTVSSTTAAEITISKSANLASSTGTILATTTIAANAQGTLSALATSTSDTTSRALAGQNLVFEPNYYMLVTMKGGVGTFSPSGACGGVFQELD